MPKRSKSPVLYDPDILAGLGTGTLGAQTLLIPEGPGGLQLRKQLLSAIAEFVEFSTDPRDVSIARRMAKKLRSSSSVDFSEDEALLMSHIMDIYELSIQRLKTNEDRLPTVFGSFAPAGEIARMVQRDFRVPSDYSSYSKSVSSRSVEEEIAEEEAERERAEEERSSRGRQYEDAEGRWRS